MPCSNSQGHISTGLQQLPQLPLVRVEPPHRGDSLCSHAKPVDQWLEWLPINKRSENHLCTYSVLYCFLVYIYSTIYPSSIGLGTQSANIDPAWLLKYSPSPILTDIALPESQAQV